ncbi:aldo/keto reductase [Oceanicola sp. 502str15]|uniref:aldo/keto reductase n=1 Tax=Oceanicola sp. 502str15 TaxID=2696061 RepID=UPI0020949D60|nr:aldo/keto reductase [Oceanicola sp. 502str15]MCO6384850.1 aldo/keto reductase [Oceanicola sp. 502str15]
MTIRNIGPAGIPNLGLGTFRMEPGKARDIVAAALSEGYRHIDTAQAYGNEAEVGKGIHSSGVPRDQIFLTTKILPRDFAAADFRTATEASLTALGLDHIDLMLLHWPSKEVPLSETLPVLDALIDEGKVRFGGVSNFTIAQVEEARSILRAPIAANQVELHPFIDQSKLLPYLEAQGIPVEAYAPLAQGGVMTEPVLQQIAEAHGTTPAAIAVAWVLHKPNGIAIPKTAKAERLAGNLAAAEVTLTAEEIDRIDGLSRRDGRIVSPDGLAPEWD